MAATFTAAAVAVPTFTGLRAASSRPAPASARPAPVSSSLSPRASLREAVATTAAAVIGSALLASNALAAVVLLGDDTGGLAFVPKELTVAAGETIVFKNNAGFPHNVIFDEDDVPSGVNSSAISMKDEDLLNAPGETYTVKLDVKGTYGVYCSPHQGAGMVGKIIVN